MENKISNIIINYSNKSVKLLSKMVDNYEIDIVDKENVNVNGVILIHKTTQEDYETLTTRGDIESIHFKFLNGDNLTITYTSVQNTLNSKVSVLINENKEVIFVFYTEELNVTEYVERIEMDKTLFKSKDFNYVNLNKIGEMEFRLV